MLEHAGESAGARFGAWLRHAPAERVPLLAALALSPAAVILHALHVPGWLAAAGTVAAAGLAYGAGERHAAAADEEHPRMRGAELAAVTGAAGLWLTAAVLWGPLAGPFCLMTLAWLAGIIAGRWWLRNHDAIRAARERREAEALAALQDRARKAEWRARRAGRPARVSPAGRRAEQQRRDVDYRHQVPGSSPRRSPARPWRSGPPASWASARAA